MVTEFTSLPHTWRLVSIGIISFRYTCGTGRRSGTQKPVIILLLWILFLATPVKNVWPQRSQSACSQVAAVLFYAQTTKFVWAQICVGDMRVSRLQAKGRQRHFSQNINPVIAGSARPAPSALSERNECVKETVPLQLLKVQSSNFQKLTENVGRPRPSQPCPASDSHKFCHCTKQDLSSTSSIT